MPVHRAGWRESRPPGVPFGVNWSSPQANGLLGWWPLHGDRGSNVAVDRVYGAHSRYHAALVGRYVGGRPGDGRSVAVRQCCYRDRVEQRTKTNFASHDVFLGTAKCHR